MSDDWIYSPILGFLGVYLIYYLITRSRRGEFDLVQFPIKSVRREQRLAFRTLQAVVLAMAAMCFLLAIGVFGEIE